MNKSSVASLHDLANNYATRWSAHSPAADSARKTRRTQLRETLEANEVFFSLMEILPDYSRCGINE